MSELANYRRMQALRTGLATVIPLQVLTLTTPADLELRICGLPQVNIDFLKVCKHGIVHLLEVWRIFVSVPGICFLNDSENVADLIRHRTLACDV